MNRRKFVAQCSAVGALASIAPGSILAAPSLYSRENFERLIGQTVNAAANGRTLKLKLAAVADATSHGEQFYVHFESTQLASFNPGLYTLRHPRIGQLDLYLDHCEQCDGNGRISATVNRANRA